MHLLEAMHSCIICILGIVSVVRFHVLLQTTIQNLS